MPQIPRTIRTLAMTLSRSPSPSSAPQSASLAHFLTTTKERYLRDVRNAKGGEWAVAMGNEAGDLDTLASAIAFAWVQTTVHNTPTVPLLQTAAADLPLRAENTHALALAGVRDPAALLTLSDLPPPPAPFPSHLFALLDHNRLAARFTQDNPAARVVAVVDHHADEGLYADAAPRTVAPAGSCASHVAGLLPPAPPAGLATLLLCAILIDTGGLRPGGKALPVDRAAAAALLPLSSLAPALPTALHPAAVEDEDALAALPAVQELAAELDAKKSDVAHLGARDLLRRDYKEYTHALPWAAGTPTIRAGLATVPVRLSAWATDKRLAEAGHAWMEERGLAVLGVLTSFRDEGVLGKSGKGKHRREMAWLVRGAEAEAVEWLAERLWAGLEASEELRVKEHEDFAVDGLDSSIVARVYKQKNADATRKTTAPLLQQILERSST